MTLAIAQALFALWLLPAVVLATILDADAHLLAIQGAPLPARLVVVLWAASWPLAVAWWVLGWVWRLTAASGRRGARHGAAAPPGQPSRPSRPGGRP